MLESTELDAVDIAAPRQMHAPLVRLAAKRGLPVLCQKPLAPNLHEAIELAAEVKNQDAPDGARELAVPQLLSRCRLVAARGRIGNVKQAQLTLLTSGVLPGPDGSRPALQRQPFMLRERRMLVAEVLIHHLDTLRMLLGPLRVTHSRTSRSFSEMAGEDGAVIQLKAAGGAAVTVFASFAAHGFPATQVDRLDILGDAGSIRLDGAQLTCTGASPAERHYDLAAEYQGSYNRTIAHFVKSLRTTRRSKPRPRTISRPCGWSRIATGFPAGRLRDVSAGRVAGSGKPLA